MTRLAGKGGVAYDRHGWILEGRRPFLYSGEIHYFRVPLDQWADRLFKARQAFLNAIGAYMAWNWHEPRPGEMDFTGGRDLDRWLRLIEEQELYIIARPGPYICSEWDFGGFPGWLAAAPLEMRSLDPAYLEPCARWLEAVDRIIAPHQLGRGGRVILYQIENEYFWGDLPYHLHLKRLAEEHGITVPIVTNENKATRGSPIIETPDPYPRHVWDVLFPEYAVRELREMQPDKPPFGMEVQGGFFSMTGAPFTAYSRFAGGSIEPGWTDVYIKTLIAAGLNGVNYYMFHGGTNFERFAGKYMTTTYDFDAAVREWGELSDRYYVIRRLGGFLASLGEALVSTDPVPGSGQPIDIGVQVLARQGNGVAFLFPRNLHARSLETTLSFQHPLTGQTRTIPRRGAYVAAPYSMSLLPIAVPLRAGLTLEHTTSQVFHLSDGDETTFVLWEREGFVGELLLSGPPAAAASWAGPIEATVEPDGLLLTYRHTRQPQLARVSWPGQRPLRLLIVDAATAGRTWLPERQGQIMPLPSTIYLLRGAQDNGDEWTLDVELRAGEPVALAFPCATPPRLATLDAQPARTIVHEEPGLARLAFDAPVAPDAFYDLAGTWRTYADEIEASPSYDDSGWRTGEAGKALEAQGWYDNGYYWYRRAFAVAGQPSHLWLSCPDLTDEITAYVNGKVVGHGLHRLEVDIAPQVRPGDNLLALRLESTGRENGGFWWPNGLLQPVYLDETQRHLDITRWRMQTCAPISSAALRAGPAEAQPGYDDGGWQGVEVSPRFDSRPTGRWSDIRGVWYRTVVDVPASWAGSALSLDFADVRDEAWVYVNGRLVGRIINRAFHSRAPGRALAIDDAFQPGRRNHLAIYVRMLGTVGGLHQRVRLVAHDQALRKGWRIAPQLGGERARWAAPDFDDSAWPEVQAPEPEPTAHGVAWYRRTVALALPEGWVMPLRLTISDTPGVATLYFNGVLIGRYCEEGPQTDFYIYEHLLRPCNTVAIAVDGRGAAARLGRVSISPFCATRRARIRCQW